MERREEEEDGSLTWLGLECQGWLLADANQPLLEENNALNKRLKVIVTLLIQ
jgi:hypothetical protein